MTARQQKAECILTNYKQQTYTLLGEGSASVVFRAEQWVYKVFLLHDIAALSYKKLQVQTMLTRTEVFANSDFFYPIKEVLKIDDDTFLLIYPFEESEPCQAIYYDEIVPFLVECWQKRILFQDIKPDNFIRVNGKLKWIDYELDKFNDNLFLNMAARAYLYCKYAQESESYLQKLARSTINQFQLPELEGLQSFMNKVFTNIIYSESAASRLIVESAHSNSQMPVSDLNAEVLSLRLPYSEAFNAEEIYWNYFKKGYCLNSFRFDKTTLGAANYFEPNNILITGAKQKAPTAKVSMVIKACVQDAEVLVACVKHIVKQTALPNAFDEIILALDTKEKDFLRQYNTNGNWETLLIEATNLLEKGIITSVVAPDENAIEQANKKWFNISSKATHTEKKVPVGAQLVAFEAAKNDYVFQMDCDVMFGRLNHNHSFINDMIKAIEEDERVLSVGFNIYKGKKQEFSPYFGQEQQGFVPEVRCCLLKKSRIEQVLPLANKVTEKGLETTWYRAVEKRQKETHTYSLRGGSSVSFFIHPQNFKKTQVDVWATIRNAVEQVTIPNLQTNEFDLAGSYYDWCATRSEDLIVVSCYRNISLARFLRYWYSLISQEEQNWGLILIDDASDNGLNHFIKTLIEPYKQKVTFIVNQQRMGVAHNTYKAIHYCSTNPEAVIVILDADDALIGNKSLKNVYEKYTYNAADVVVGKMYRTDKLTAHYPYTPNFVNPRLYGGNVWQHIRSFKKYLFDSLDFTDLKIPNAVQEKEDILLSKRFSKQMVYPEHCWDFAYMVPIVEMAKNPMAINHFNVLHDRTTVNTPAIKAQKEAEIAILLSKPNKTPVAVVMGRRTFLPNLKKIEIDITYECNLKCINCNRSSTQAPIKNGMQLSQIVDFINQSIELNKQWELINLLGGEPTLHSDFQTIVSVLLNEYIIPYSPETILQITSNGYGELVQSQLKQLPKHPNVIIDYASFKDDRVVSYFSPFNDAPVDEDHSDTKEYHKGCWVTSYCGIGLNQLGYYPCGVAGGIDRIFELNLGFKHLKEVDESIAKLLDTFCKFCGNFTDYEKNKGNFIPRNEKAAITSPIISKTWKEQYKIYNGK